MRAPAFHAQESGGVSIITALCATAMIGFTGLAVDVGSVFLESRRLQGTADLAAVAAAQNPARATLLAQQTVDSNDWPGASLTATSGTYTADRTIDPTRRFVAARNGANAAHVEVTTTAPLFFGRLFVPSGHVTITRRATAAQTRWASFQIGSRLASLNGGIANEVLGGLTGSQVNLSVMDYNALLSADVDLMSYVSALRTQMDLKAATFGETLSHRIEAPAALEAIANVLDQSNGAAAASIRRLERSTSSASSIDSMNQLIDLGPYQNSSEPPLSGSTSFRVNAMDLATAVLGIAGGDRQVRLQVATNTPSIASINAWLAIGERPNNSPWIAVTNEDQVIIRTAQMRLYVEASTPSSGVLAAVGGVRVPVLVELASAQAKLDSVTCGIGAQPQVRLLVNPSIGSVTLGEINLNRLDDFKSDIGAGPAHLIHTALVSVDGQAHVTLGGEHWTGVTFSNSDITGGVTKNVATTDTAQATISSLLGNTQLTVRAAGLGLTTPALGAGVQSALSSVGAPLDALINNLTSLFGVRLGQADVRVNGVRCGGAALVA